MKSFNPAWFYLIPLLLTIHNIEEALSMPAWSRAVPRSFHPPVTDRQFAIAVFIVTLMALAYTGFARLWRQGSRFIFLMTILAWILLINALFPHTVASLCHGRLAPGMVTAAALYLTVIPVLLWRSRSLNMISRRDFLVALLLAPMLGLSATALSLVIGGLW